MSHERRWSVCTQLLKRHTDTGVAPKSISFTTSNKRFNHRLESTAAYQESEKQSRYVFHTLLNEEQISECSIKICDDEFSAHSEFITLIPIRILTELKRHNADKAVSFKIGKFQHLWFGEFWMEDDTKERAIIKPTPNTQENRDRIRNAFEEENSAQKWFQCQVVILPEEFITMYSIYDLLLKGVHKEQWKDDKHYASLIRNYQELDLSEFRASLRSINETAADRFVKALHILREDFVHKIFDEGFSSEYYENIKRIFDLTFLRIFHHKGKTGEPLHVVYDYNKETLYFVDVICKDKADRITANKVYKRSSHGLHTDNRLIQMAVRENWIKYQCLQGQDDEFNIFRSLCFAPSSGIKERYHIGFMALTLQLLLCFGITVDSWEKWSETTILDIWEALSSLDYELSEVLIVAISALAFGFILQRLRKTVHSFKRFYRNMDEVCIIPKSIIVLDFTSNLVVGTWMAIVTPWLLLKSQDIETVVLNSFALTIFVELDDLANIFESDQPFLLKEDANGMKWSILQDVDRGKDGVPKRRIGGDLTFVQGLVMAAMFILSPLYETFKITTSLFSLGRYCCLKKKHAPLTESDSVNQSENQDVQGRDIKERKSIDLHVECKEVDVDIESTDMYTDSEKVQLRVTQSQPQEK